MKRISVSPFLAAALSGLAGMGVVRGEGGEARGVDGLENRLAALRRENAVLKRELVAANQREADAAEALARIKLRLEALGKNLIDGGDDRHVQAVSDFAVLDRRVRQLEEATLRLLGSVNAYLHSAIAADPDLRAKVELRLRELEVLLGLRARPQKSVARGSLQHAKVVSIDPESGLVVLNVGEKQEARIGLVFRITRGGDPVGEGMVALTREDVCGIFIQKLENEAEPVRFGDLASLKSFEAE